MRSRTRREMRETVRNNVLLRGEESDNAVSIVESTMPAGAPGPPLHSHAFDEAFYVLDGELTFRLCDRRTTAGSEAPKWALQPLPEVNYLGPRIGEAHGRRARG